MMGDLSFTILGCGSSGGVPRLGGTGVTAILIIAKINDQDVHFSRAQALRGSQEF